MEILSELIKVKRSGKIKIDNPQYCYHNLKFYNSSITIGVDYDIIIVPIIDTTLKEETVAAANTCFLNDDDNRPIMGYLLINQNYSF